VNFSWAGAGEKVDATRTRSEGEMPLADYPVQLGIGRQYSLYWINDKQLMSIYKKQFKLAVYKYHYYYNVNSEDGEWFGLSIP